MLIFNYFNVKICILNILNEVMDEMPNVFGIPASRAQPWPHRETLSKQWVVMARGSTKQLLRYWNLKLRRESSTEDEYVFGNQGQKGCIKG